MTKFEIRKTKARVGYVQFYFVLKAPNNEIIFNSETYTTKQSAVKGINSIKLHSQREDLFKRLISKDEKYYFVLKSTNNKLIACSEMYETLTSCDKGIRSVMTNAAGAEIVDLTKEK